MEIKCLILKHLKININNFLKFKRINIQKKLNRYSINCKFQKINIKKHKEGIDHIQKIFRIIYY